METNDHDLLIRMDTKLDIFIRQQEIQAAALHELGGRFDIERNRVWEEINALKDINLAAESFNRGRKWVFATVGVILGSIPPSIILALIALI